MSGDVVCLAVSQLSCTAFSVGGWIAKWAASSVRVLKGPGSIPGGAKVLGTDRIGKYLPVSVSSYVEVCWCLLCSVCFN